MRRMELFGKEYMSLAEQHPMLQTGWRTAATESSLKVTVTQPVGELMPGSLG